MHHDITGVLLAGGNSLRMGTNKAFLKMQGEYIIVRMARLLRSLFDVTLLSTNSPDEFRFLDLPTIPDQLTNAGPLAGIHAGLVHAQTEKIFVLGCDLPLMNRETIQFLIAYPSAYPATIATADGFLQPLCGIYTKKMLPLIEAKCRASESDTRDCRLLDLLHLAGLRSVPIEELMPGYKANSFYNMNSPEDYEFIKRQIEIPSPSV